MLSDLLDLLSLSELSLCLSIGLLSKESKTKKRVCKIKR